jgi:hypothetical protein
MEALDLTAATNAVSAALAAEDRANWGYDHAFEVSDLGRGDAETEAFARAAVVAAAPHILTAAGKVVSEEQCRQIASSAIVDQMATVIFDERKRVLDEARKSTVLMTRADGSEVAAVQWSTLLEALGMKP